MVHQYGNMEPLGAWTAPSAIRVKAQPPAPWSAPEAQALLRTEAQALLRSEAQALLRTEAQALLRTEAQALLRTGRAACDKCTS